MDFSCDEEYNRIRKGNARRGTYIIEIATEDVVGSIIVVLSNINVYFNKNAVIVDSLSFAVTLNLSIKPKKTPSLPGIDRYLS